MEKTLLLSNITNYFRDGILKMNYDRGTGIEIFLKSCRDIKYSTLVLTSEMDIFKCKKDFSVPHCLYSYKLFLSKNPNNILIIKEGLDESTGELAYLKVEIINNNLDCLLLRLCKEFDNINNELGISLESIGEYVYDNNERYIDIYSLNMNIEGTEEKVILNVFNKEVIGNELYEKVPVFKTTFNEDILKCIWSLIGDYSLVVELIRVHGVYYPVMYCLCLDCNILGGIL